MKKVVWMLISTAVLAVLTGFAGDDLAEIEAALAKEAAAKSRMKTSGISLLSEINEKNNDGVVFWATGEDLNVTKGGPNGGTIYLYFDIPEDYIPLKIFLSDSIKVTMNAYDVDFPNEKYPNEEEFDKVFLNDEYIGRLVGGDMIWNENTFVVPETVLKKGRNVLRIEVNVERTQGWVTRIEWAKIVIPLSPFGLSATLDRKESIKLKWKLTGKPPYTIYRSTLNDQAFFRLHTTQKGDYGYFDVNEYYEDRNVWPGQRFYYYVESSDEPKKRSEVVCGQCAESLHVAPRINSVSIRSLEDQHANAGVLVAGDAIECEITFDEASDLEYYQIEAMVGFATSLTNPKKRKEHYIKWDLYDGELSRELTEDRQKCLKTIADASAFGREVLYLPNGQKKLIVYGKLVKGDKEIEQPDRYGAHGSYKWKIICGYRKNPNHNENKSNQENILRSCYFDLQVPVYFAKDGRDVNGNVLVTNYDGDGELVEVHKQEGPVPNWFKYWLEDGVIKFTQNDGLIPSIIKDKLYYTIGDAYGYSFTPRGYNPNFGEIAVTDECGGYHYREEGVSISGIKFGGVYGPLTLAANLAHEYKHYCNKRDYWANIRTQCDFDMSNMATEEIEEVQKSLDSDFRMQTCKVTGHIGDNAIRAPECFYEGLDYLTDDMEADENAKYGISLDINDVDTYDVASKKVAGNNYHNCGDDEFVAMLAGREVELNPSKYVDNTKNFAYDPEDPGFAHQDGARIAARSIRMKNTAIANQSDNVTNADVENNVSISAVEFSFSDTNLSVMAKIEATGFVNLGFVATISDSVSNELTKVGGRITAGSYTLNLPVDLGSFKYPEDNRVFVSKIDITSGNGEVCATFDEGLALSSELPVYIPPIAVPVGVVYGESWSNGCLSFKTDIVVNRNDATNLMVTAELSTTNGEFLVFGSVTGDYSGNTNEVEFTFASKDLLRSDYRGRYLVKTIAVYSSGEFATAVGDVYTTTNGLSDFSIERSVQVLPETFTLLPYGGNSGDEYSGIACTFDVTNAASQTKIFRANATLVGTNGNVVCSVDDVEVCISNTIQHVTLWFAGSSIAASNVDGPYSVARLELSDVEGTEVDIVLCPEVFSEPLHSSQFNWTAIKKVESISIESVTDYDAIVARLQFDLQSGGRFSVGATLINSDGIFVARKEKIIEVSSGGAQSAILEFRCSDVYDDAAGGPYSIGYSYVEKVDSLEERVYGKTEVNDIAWKTANLFVDKYSLVANPSGRDWDSPFGQISEAIAKAGSNDVIVVKPGVYECIAAGNVPLRIISYSGAKDAIIDGGGTNRCAYLGSGSTQTNTVLVGFTLRNGAADTGAGAMGGTLLNCVIESNLATLQGGGTYYGVQADCIYRNNVASNDTESVHGGAAYYGTGYNCIYTNNVAIGAVNAYGGAVHGGVYYDCVISANRSSRNGGGCHIGTCHRCRVFGNEAYIGGGCTDATMYDSLICGNSARTGGGSHNSRLFGCTVAGNIANNAGGMHSGKAHNSIVWDNQAMSGARSNYVNAKMWYSCSAPLVSGDGNICGDPLFIDPTKADYRLTKGSPCLNAGDISYVGESEKDLNLKDRVQDEVVDMGCYEGVYSVVAETQDTPAPVPHVWLDAYSHILSCFGGDYEAMALSQSPGGDGRGKFWPNGSAYYMWQDFVAGTNPTNGNSVFSAEIEIVDGKPVVKWEPDTPELRATRVYRTFGKKTLVDRDWVDITDQDLSEYRFFKVTVDLP